ncbi:MAG: CHASE domain-containing protein [Candidatus Marinimicrobia bacterium]|nr:CHASE domain-containing protein [Candidatus Neomarinimicrobiota bacterium]
MNNLKKMKMKFSAKSIYGMFIILIIGLSITAFIYISELKSVELNIRLSLQEKSLERLQGIRQEIHEYLNMNIAIGALFHASQEVTREEFTIFVSHYFTTHHHSIQALEWIPIVQSSEKEEFIKRAHDDGFADFQFREKNQVGEMVLVGSRAEYYPVYYLEPLSGNEKALGYDLGSDSTRLDAILRARESGKLSATGRINLVQKSNIEPGILIFEPVYDNSTIENNNRYSQKDGSRKVIGFVLGVFSIKALLLSALNEYPDVGLDVSIFDLSVSSGSKFLTAVKQSEDNQDLTPPPLLSALKQGVHFLRSISVADRTWELVFTPRKRFLAAIPNRSKFILISGLLLSFLMVIAYRYVNVSIAQRILYQENLEITVDERTKELTESLVEVEEAKDYIDGILGSVADGLVVTDMKNRVIMMNRAAEDLLGVRFSEAANKPIDLAIEDKTLRERIKMTLQKKTTGYSFDFEWSGEKDSKEIFRARTSVIVDSRGKQSGIITIFHNVTHEREIDRMKNEFISMAAHELRTPLTSIRGFSEILLTRDNLKQSDKTKFLGYIQDQSEVLSKIISDLLDISRIESGKSFILHKDNCLVGDAIMQVTIPYIEQLPKNSIRVHLPKKEIELFLDKEKMAQVLENIVSNSIKYSPEKVDIDITGEIKGDYLHVIMEDRGIGMTPEQLEKIYDKFYRADTSNTAITGTGLGMSIAKAIIEAHDGELWVESEFGKGTKVTFSVPMQNMDGIIKVKSKKADKKLVSKDLN